MVSFNFLKTVSFLALVFSLVSAQVENDICAGFKIEPSGRYYINRSGPCFAFSYDVGPSPPSTPALINVYVYETETNNFVDKVIDNLPASGNSTPYFANTNIAGNYYYVVTYDDCPPIVTSPFTIFYEPFGYPPCSV